LLDRIHVAGTQRVTAPRNWVVDRVF